MLQAGRGGCIAPCGPHLAMSPTGLMAHPSFQLPSPHSSPLASPGLMTGGDMSEAEPRHFPQTRNPAQGFSPQDSSLGGDAGGLGTISSSHPWPMTR